MHTVVLVPLVIQYAMRTVFDMKVYVDDKKSSTSDGGGKGGEGKVLRTSSW